MLLGLRYLTRVLVILTCLRALESVACSHLRQRQQQQHR